MADDTNQPSDQVQVTKIMENGRNFRWLMVTALIFGCAWLVKDGVVEIVSAPDWPKVAGVVVLCLLGPSGIIMAVSRTRNRAVRKHSRRTAELERSLDPARTSSLGEPRDQEP